MASSIISIVQSKLSAAFYGSPPSSSSSSDQVLSGIKKDLESMETTLRRIQAVLNDAEEREIQDASVKLWLKELRWVVYDAENVLGEYQYEIRRAEIMSSAAETSLKRKRQDDKAYEFTSVLKQLSIPQKISAILKRFNKISKDRKRLQLREEIGTRRHSTSYVPQQSTSSHVDESDIFGREDDKEAVIQMLLSDKVISSKISVIAIVGMGGLGKTTLAQCVYNDPRICQHFNSMGWVCVSDDFDVKRLTGEIIQSITKNSYGLTQLDALQSTLKEIVDGKKVLVVLDDVWNETPRFWESLKAPFLNATTVRVLVTTRNESVAKIMQTACLNMYRLGCLPEDKCWKLFCHHAFSGQNPEEHPRLVEVGRKIMQKCGGLPLAVKTLGSLLLYYGTEEEKWKEVLESEIWELDGAKDDILPALKLSYYRMPTHLKPCFLFTSVYPKDFRFEKDKVIKMWMAQDYILPRGNKSLEDIGSEYFDELQRRSFFLNVKNVFEIERYVLHDIVHDLARYISENEHHSIVLKSNEKICPIAAEVKVRHLFVECQEDATLCQVPLEITRDLRTLIVSKRHLFDVYSIVDYLFDDYSIVDCQFEHSVHLRVLEVDCRQRLPYSIVNLKHLCYLNWNHWSSLGINDDSSFLSHLYNMQTLYLYWEYDFVWLVSSIRDLANLRHLHLASLFDYGSTCILSSMSDDADLTQRGICYYSSFSKLVEISLSDSSSGANWLSLLPFSLLPSLRRLRVKYMNNIKRVGHENYCYCPLHLGCPDIRKSVITTNNNVGFPCLEELIFESMWEWEEWSGVTDGDFPCLRKLTLTWCRLLSQIRMLPSSLKTLHISNCESLKSLPVNNEQVRFPYMEEVEFYDMRKWEEWPGLNSGDFPRLRKLTLTECPSLSQIPMLPSSLKSLNSGYFPCLCRLTINRCQKLQGFPTLSSSSSLKDLSIKSCWSLTSLTGLQNLTSLQSLELKRCPNLHISPQEALPSKPRHVKIVDCPLLQEWCNMQQFNCIQKSYGLAELTIYDSGTIIKDLGVDNLTSLKRLEIRSVKEIHLSPNGWLPPMIQILEVCSCNSLLSLSLRQILLLLTRLEIRNCPELDSVDGLHNLPNLEELSFANCPILDFSDDKCSLPSSLQSLSVKDCEALWSLPLLHENLSSLEKLAVLNCTDLTIMAGLQNLSSLKTLTIAQCPRLRLSSDEQLPSMPHFLSIADCPGLEEWCQQQSIPYGQFVNFTKVMSANMELSKKEAGFEVAALKEIPFQYRATQSLRPFQIQERITDGLSVLPPREVIEWDNLVAAISRPPAATSETSGTRAPMEQLNQGLRELKLNSRNECNEENRGQSNRTTSEEKQAEGGDGSQNLNSRDEWSSLKVLYSEIENAICESSEIGKGGFGSVYKGELRGTMVAIKILDSSSKQGVKEFLQEIEVLYEMRHPNFVKLVGACFEKPALVYEYLPHRSLEDCLKKNPNLLTWEMRTRIIYEICSALIHLHSRSVVHSDLKPANILLDANFKSKLSDFGLCRFLPKDMTTAVFLETVPKGTSGYIDPWFFETCILRPGSDLYSFGVTILKLLTRMPAVGLGRKACDADENTFREMIDPTAGSWPFEMAKELLYWSLQCCYHNEKSRELLKDMLTCLEDMLTEIETLGEGKFKRVVKGTKAAGEDGE